ncbi:MAG: hypothetical protein HYX75_01095 [Acidobacteria bacterium]|nr:hypothetical protein [Acidobacteriota bacterium]
MKVGTHGKQFPATDTSAPKTGDTKRVGENQKGIIQRTRREAFRDKFERLPGDSAFQQLVRTPASALPGAKGDLPAMTVHHDGHAGGRPKGGIDQQWVDRYKVLEDYRKSFENTIITPANRDEQEFRRFQIRGLETVLGLQPGQRAVVNGETGEFRLSPPESDTYTPTQQFDHRDPESMTHPAGGGGPHIGPQPGQGGTLTGLGGAGGSGGGGGTGTSPGAGGGGGSPIFQGGSGYIGGSHPGHDRQPGTSPGGAPATPGGPPNPPDTPSHPTSQPPKTDREKDKEIKSAGSGGGEHSTTKSTMAVVDKLISSWDDQPKSESGGEELPSDDPMSGHGGGDDIGARGHIPGRPRGITQQQADLVGPAFAKKTGADDEETPVVGNTSGKSSADDLENDVGGPHMRRPGGGGEAGNLMTDLRVVSPIDPSKV